MHSGNWNHGAIKVVYIIYKFNWKKLQITQEQHHYLIFDQLN